MARPKSIAQNKVAKSHQSTRKSQRNPTRKSQRNRKIHRDFGFHQTELAQPVSSGRPLDLKETASDPIIEEVMAVAMAVLKGHGCGCS
jgi:hypothetical protein